MSVGLRKAVAQVSVKGDLLEQIPHGFVEVFVRSVRNFEFVPAGRTESGGKLLAQITLQTIFHTFLSTHKLAVIFDSERQQDGGSFTAAINIGLTVRSIQSRFLVGSDCDAAMTKVV